MIKKICSLVLVVLLVLQGGCWGRKELGQLAIVMAAGVDRAPGGDIRLTVQLARPRAFGGGAERPSGAQENNAWVISENGETVLDAQRNLEKRVSRSIYWGHNVILVFGEELAREGIRQAFNFFTRSPTARETIWVMVARGKAEDVLNSHSQLENTSAQSAGSMLRMRVGEPVMLKDLSMMLASKGTNPALPRVELTASGRPQGPGMVENIPQGYKGAQQPPVGTHAEITLTGTGIFKDDKLVGWLNVRETRGLLWLKDEIKRGVVTVPSPVEPGKKISINITRGNTRVEAFFDGESVWFDVWMKMEGTLWEQQSKEKLTNPVIYKAIEKAMSREIENIARGALNKAQLEYGVDIFGFGEAFHRKYKREWASMQNRWNEVFAGAQVNIAVEGRIRRTGLTTNRLSEPQ
jgi:spore germination protein KC